MSEEDDNAPIDPAASDADLTKAILQLKKKLNETAAEAAVKAEKELLDMETAKRLGVDRLDIAGKLREVEEKRLAAAQELNEENLKNNVFDKEKFKDAKTQYEQKQKLVLLQKRGLAAEKAGAKDAESAAARYLGLTKDGGKMFDNLGKRAKGWMSEMKTLFTVQNVAAAGVTKIKEATIGLAYAQDGATVSFNKATGQAGAYNSQIRGLERSMLNAGVTSAEAGQAYQDLFTTVTDFSNMSKSTQDDLAKNVALLNELGVSSSESAQSIQFLTKVMGKSKTQATGQIRELFAFAQELGVSAAGMSADFIKMQPQIAALGDTGIQSFKDLQAQAKATGISFDSLLSITAKFDTFAGAAEQVGKLNALMGGPFLNTLEMVAETDPAERMKKLSEGINASGLSFDQMSYYQKKAMTAAAGLNSEMELSLLMSGKLESARGPVKTTAEFAKLAEQTTQFNTVMEEMKQLGISLAISLGPLVDKLKIGLDILTFFGPAIKVISAALAGMALVLAFVAAKWVYAAASKALFDGGTSMLRGALAVGAVVGAGLAFGSLAVDDGSSYSGKGFAKGGTTGGGLVLVGERGPEMVSLPMGSHVAANGSAAHTRMEGAFAKGNGPAHEPPGGYGASSAPPVVNVDVRLGNEKIKQLFYGINVNENTGATPNTLASSQMDAFANKIV
tara:strand:+ start:16 stop:2043 length:2028 start_codon:yes stop_codon:yes gene_type:complete